MFKLINKRIILGVTGGIAAYKSAELVRRLQDQGAQVRVVMTPGAEEFIRPLTMQPSGSARFTGPEIRVTRAPASTAAEARA